MKTDTYSIFFILIFKYVADFSDFQCYFPLFTVLENQASFYTNEIYELNLSYTCV